MNEENERERRGEEVNIVEQEVAKIRKDEVRKALRRMKSGKAVGPDDIPVEVWKCLGETAVEFLSSLFNRILESEKTPEEWRRGVLYEDVRSGPPTPSRPELSPSSFQNAATPRVPRVNDQLMCEPILREILTTMETIKQQQQIILLQLQNNLRKPIEVPEVTGIPLKTLEELLNLEQSVAAQGEHKQKLVTYFGLAGGLTIKETVWRIMAKLMTNQLAKQINWRGVHGKYGFEQLVLKDVVLKSVRQNSATASAPDGEIEKYIKRWLQLASDRDGGRRERAMKQANS
uniref:DUF4806 domain-containing protein n=1 Tax=Monopterus albus TaxID=43700 RepID=A0A3Q3JNL4_MONAL